MITLPILMVDWTVRATIDGHKTETRRVVTRGTSACEVPLEDLELEDAWSDPVERGHGCLKASALNHPDEGSRDSIHSIYPRWAPDDFLYVREAWAPLDGIGDPGVTAIAAGALYRADHRGGLRYDVKRWRPSIYMPRKIARIWLRVESVHAERLQEISGQGALDEGIERNHVSIGDTVEDVRGRFRIKWDALNGKGGFGWDANPWVWVIRYSLTKGPRDE